MFRLKALRDKRLIEACKKGNLKRVKKLAGKTDASVKGEALEYAVKHGHLDIIKCLIENKADVHIDNDWPLRHAVKKGRLEIVKYLISKGANIHALDDMPLRRAAASGYLEIIKYLIENGANIHAQDDEALKWIVGGGPLDAVEYLVDHGANVRVIKLEELTSDKDRNILNILLKGLSTQELMPFLVSNSNNIRELAKRVLERRQKTGN